MLKNKVVKGFFYIIACLLWPAVTYAASVTLGNTVNDVPAEAWVVVFLLATASGLVALLERFKDMIMLPDGAATMKRAWRWFVAAHYTGALLTGLLSFFFAEQIGMPDNYEAIFIAVMSYGGARVLNRMADGLTDSAVNRAISLIGGTPPAANPPPQQ